MANVIHANLLGVDLHEDKRIKQPVRAASTANITLTGPGTTIDGVTMANGDRFLAKDQTTASQNGVYVFNGSASTATRATDAAAAADFVYGFEVFVREGTQNALSRWLMTVTAAITLGTTSLTFVRLASPVAQSSSAAAVATSGTITTAGVSVARVSPTGAVTGVILQAGTFPGQEVTVVNEAVAANTVTFAASGTSNVADGTSSVIAGLTARSFVWDSATSLWYPKK